MDKKKCILVTSALPYANGPIHLGHLVEYIQTDIWVRLNKFLRHDVTYICADDAHGTPIMLKAKEDGISPEELINKSLAEHKKDFEDFLIKFDHYSSTHSETNEKSCIEIFQRLTDEKYIYKKNIDQYFDEKVNIFLPDRYIKGTCPKCGAEDQYGDSCEKCGATYNSTEIINPISSISGSKPIIKSTEHFFFELKKFEKFLTEWLENTDIQPSIKNKLNEWLSSGIQDWDITRDSPYFGFKIPGENNKYFYVWMDAPIGYIASLNEYKNINSEVKAINYWNEDIEIYHFIGKDIAYFHCLFWPAILRGIDYNLPTNIFCHGFLTINGMKMSKSRNTFIRASDFVKKFDPEFLRYYFASKLSNTIEDIDLNFEDFRKKINSDLIGKVINLLSRSVSFIKNNDYKLAINLSDENHYQNFVSRTENILKELHLRKYSSATKEIMKLADEANTFFNDNAPWKLDKDKDKKIIQEISTQAINYYKIIITLLSPILPNLFDESCKILNIKKLNIKNYKDPTLDHEINKFSPLKNRIDEEDVKEFVN